MASRIRASIKKLFEPEMIELGFSARYPYFQRKRDGRLELVNVVHDKWGGGLFLEFAVLVAGDLKTSWGEVVPEADIEVAHTDPSTRARLMAVAADADSRNKCFRYEAFADDRKQCDDLINRLVELLPQVVGWLDRGEIGPNIVPFSTE